MGSLCVMVEVSVVWVFVVWGSGGWLWMGDVGGTFVVWGDVFVVFVGVSFMVGG